MRGIVFAAVGFMGMASPPRFGRGVPWQAYQLNPRLPPLALAFNRPVVCVIEKIEGWGVE